MVHRKTRKTGGTHPSLETRRGLSLDQLLDRSRAARIEHAAREAHNKRLAEKALFARETAMSHAMIAEQLADEEQEETNMRRIMRQASRFLKNSKSTRHNKSLSIHCDAVTKLMENIIGMFKILTGHPAFTNTYENGNVVLTWSLKGKLNGGIIQKLYDELRIIPSDVRLELLSKYQYIIINIVNEYLDHIEEHLVEYFKQQMTRRVTIHQVGEENHEMIIIHKVNDTIKSIKSGLVECFEEWEYANLSNVKGKFYKICKTIVLQLNPIYETIKGYYMKKGIIRCNETVIFPTMSISRISRSMKSTFRPVPGKMEDRSINFGYDDIYTRNKPIIDSISPIRNKSVGGRKMRKSKRKSRSKF